MDRTAAALAVRAAINGDDSERRLAARSAAETLFIFGGLVSKHAATFDSLLHGNERGDALLEAEIEAEIQAAYELRDAATKAIDALINAVAPPAVS